MRLFFRNFFVSKGSPLQFFAVLRQNGCWKIPKGPPFQFFSALWDFFSKIKNFHPFNFLMFCDWMDGEKPQKVPPFSFFSALWDFFRKLFSHQRVPFQFLWYFTTHWVFKNPKGSPLSVFRHCETFFWKFVFSPKGSPFNCNKNVDNFGSVPLLARQGLALAGPGAPLSPFFGFSKKNSIKFRKKNFKFFFKKSLLRFLSLRYGADFRRSRLVSLWNPSQASFERFFEDFLYLGSSSGRG